MGSCVRGGDEGRPKGEGTTKQRFWSEVVWLCLWREAEQSERDGMGVERVCRKKINSIMVPYIVRVSRVVDEVMVTEVRGGCLLHEGGFGVIIYPGCRAAEGTRVLPVRLLRRKETEAVVVAERAWATGPCSGSTLTDDSTPP